jgi:ATP-dependent exoDNAse (exonuclease V) beta subunit
MILEKPLKVLSASAGSGKTFSLVQNYLKITLQNDDSAYKFSKILAMTFTNKAAWEMKERIIEALDLIAYQAKDKEGPNYKKAKGLLDITSKNLGQRPEELIKRAAFLLSLILHNYEDFSVMTIDKFNLRLIRTFARELNLNEDFEVIISTDDYIAQVVEEIMSEIGTESQGEMTQLAVNYAKTNFEEGDKWDFKSNLIEFSKLLGKESNYNFVETIKKMSYEKEDFNDVVKQLRTIRKQYEDLKLSLLELFSNHALTAEELPAKTKGIYSFYDSELPERELSSAKIPSNTILKTLSGDNIKPEHRFPSDLRDATVSFLDKEAFLGEEYYLLNTIRKNFHNLAFLKYIAETIDQLRERDGVLLISEFNKLISNLLMKESAPFIYERIGTRFENYLLDEFQDTSRLQLINLIPLLEDSLAHNYQNLIVGDPKQAIYRFRNGLVEQFIELPRIYNPEKDPQIERKSDFFELMGEKDALQFNWRSAEKIVTFNNHFFSAFSQYLPNDFSAYYNDVKQSPKGKDNGLIQFDLWSSKEEEESKGELEYRYIYETIQTVKSEGYKYGDICILSRTKNDSARWADALSSGEDPINVVSADSLKVNTDLAVNVFIDYLKLRKNPRLKTAQMQFAVDYFTLTQQNVVSELAKYSDDEKRLFDLDGFINCYFKDENIFFFDYENMYDLGQKFLRLLTLNELENPYLNCLMGILLEFDLRNGPDLRTFIEYWDKEGAQKSIQVPNNDNAVKIMTAHTAKGLEFPVVILPTLTWDFKKNISKDSAFYEIDNELIYTNFFAPDFAPNEVKEGVEQERNRRFLDEVNLLYVAMTRPVDRMYIYMDTSLSYKVKKDISSSGKLNNYVTDLLLNNKLGLPPSFSDDTKIVFGSNPVKQESIADERSAFYPTFLKDFLWFPEISFSDQEQIDADDIDKERRFGRQLHLVLSKIKKPSAMDEVIEYLLKRDLIEVAFLDDLKDSVSRVLSIPEYVELLDGNYVDLAEQDIVFSETEVKRPDRMFMKGNAITIIDFKSGKATEKDKRQLMEYRNILHGMGYDHVEGKLLYTAQGKLERLF